MLFRKEILKPFILLDFVKIENVMPNDHLLVSSSTVDTNILKIQFLKCWYHLMAKFFSVIYVVYYLVQYNKSLIPGLLELSVMGRKY